MGVITLISIIVMLLVGSVYTNPAVAEQPAQRNYLDETRLERDMRMDWWREARFGLFIHWGLYAVPAGVWNGEQIPGIGEW
ncbi:MAG TPA: alpha-L-fucosidase, partial [bacterium]|nr:alpha-L-fucosidase [bacterium]